MGKNMCRVGYIMAFSPRRCGFALRVLARSKQLLDVRLTNWQLLGGSRAKEPLRRALRGMMCAVLHLRRATCAHIPEQNAKIGGTQAKSSRLGGKNAGFCDENARVSAESAPFYGSSCAL